MLKYYIQVSEAFKRLRANKDGVVSFEYVIVAACIVGAVITAFGTGASGAIEGALAGVIGKITAAVNAVTVAAS